MCPFNEWDHPDWVIQVVGLEPTRVSPPHFECGASTNSATPAGSRLVTLKVLQRIEELPNTLHVLPLGPMSAWSIWLQPGPALLPYRHTHGRGARVRSLETSPSPRALPTPWQLKL